MMSHLKESEIHQPLTQTARIANRMEKRFQGVVARPLILYLQKDTPSQEIRDSQITDTDI